jgi:hypothetical protein
VAWGIRMGWHIGRSPAAVGTSWQHGGARIMVKTGALGGCMRGVRAKTSKCPTPHMCVVVLGGLQGGLRHERQGSCVAPVGLPVGGSSMSIR